MLVTPIDASAPKGRIILPQQQTLREALDNNLLTMIVQDTEVKLTQTEYNILAYLSEYSGKVLTYSLITKAIWGDAAAGSVKRLQVNMANIRRKLGIKPGDDSYIVNELGVGYRMNTD